MSSIDSRIIITGAAGFIGSNLLRYFYERGYTVIGIDNLSSGYLDNIKWIYCYRN
jgi:nucleoside-diphosphate-sugar epimerase